MLMLINLAEVDHEAENKKCDCRVDRGLGEHIAGIRTKGGFSHSTAHGGTHSTVRLRLLGQHDEDQKQGDEDQYKRRNANENAHEKGSTEQSDPSVVNCRGWQVKRLFQNASAERSLRTKLHYAHSRCTGSLK